MNTDITYNINGLFTRFFADSKEGEEVIREIIRVTGDNVLRNDHAKQTIKELRSLGYKVYKAKKATKKEINKILNELDDIL